MLTGPGAKRPLWAYDDFFHGASRPKSGAMTAMATEKFQPCTLPISTVDSESFRSIIEKILTKKGHLIKF